MYVITGASGRTGHAAADRLLQEGYKVRVIGRDPGKLVDLERRGAQVYQADQFDADRMTEALYGAEAAYLVIQPNYLPDHPDFAGFQDGAAAALSDAVNRAGLRRAVALSSWGAQHSCGTGPVVGLHRFEERLAALPDLDVTFLRAGYFMENLLDQLNSVRDQRRLAAPLRPDVPLPLVTTVDVGVVAAHELMRGPKGHSIRELHGERAVTMDEVANILTHAVGELVSYEQFSLEEFYRILRGSGVAPNVAQMMAEVPEAINTGHLCTMQPRTTQTSTGTPIEDFLATEFVPYVTYEST